MREMYDLYTKKRRNHRERAWLLGKVLQESASEIFFEFTGIRPHPGAAAGMPYYGGLKITRRVSNQRPQAG
jgi:hypothetical protein